MLKPPEIRDTVRCRPTAVKAVEIDAPGTLNPKIRRCLMALNLIDICIGAACLTLGTSLHRSISESVTIPPPLMPMLLIGIVPLAIGSLGVICIMIGRRLWILAWTLINFVPVTVVHAYFHLSECLKPEIYNVSMHIYGHCQPRNETCVCSWSQHELPLSGPCQLIWFVTTCFLSVIALYTVFLAGSIISSVLGCVVVSCLNRCMSQNSAGHESTMNARNYSTFVTDFLPQDGASRVLCADDISTAI